jgi:flagellar basal-body rod protein FlgC
VIFRAMQISASALTASRLQMDLAANNLANINTTRGADGQPYRRRYVVQAERQESFPALLDRQSGQGTGGGVQVTAIQEDQSPFKLKYDPAHPDADTNGMVRLPNVDMLQEITDMMMATRVYEANVTALNAGKAMELKALDIGRA